jgi:hypothetical protein
MREDVSMVTKFRDKCKSWMLKMLKHTDGELRKGKTCPTGDVVQHV